MTEVTCAIIEHNACILICQRSAHMKLPGKWEFPGGKVESNESNEMCLIREIKEELGLGIYIREPLTPTVYTYPDFSIRLHPFICTWKAGQLQLVEHSQAKWVSPDELFQYDWAAADIPIVQEYLLKQSLSPSSCGKQRYT